MNPTVSIGSTTSGRRLSVARFVTPLVSIVLLLNVVVLVLAGLGLSGSRARYAERAAIATSNLAIVLERELSATIDKADLILQIVGEEVERINATPGADPSMLDEFMRRQSLRIPELHGLRTANADGDVVNGFGLVPGRRANLRDRAYFVQLAGNPQAGLVISEPLVSRVSDQWEIVLARRIKGAGGSFDGVVYATIALKYFVEKFAALDVGAHGVVALRDPALRLIARHPALMNLDRDVGSSNVSPLLRGPVVAGQATGTYTGSAGSDGIERTTSFRRFSKYPLLLVVGMGSDDYLAEWRGEAARTASLVAVFALLTLAFTVLIARSWRRREADVDALAMQEQKFRRLIESSPDALVITGPNETITIVNRRAELMFGYEQRELLGRSMDILLTPAYQGLHLGRQAAGTGEASEMSKDRDLWAVTKSGLEFPVSISLSPIETDLGGMVAAAIRDITERRASEAKIEFLAHHDALTGLPNRLVVRSRFEQAVAQAARTHSKIALLFVDLDNFKMVNDTIGHMGGDVLLKAVAERLLDAARGSDIVSRQGGDEFLVVFTELIDAQTAASMVERLVGLFQQPCRVQGQEISISASVGISMYPDDGSDFDTLLMKADVALYQAKGAGRNTFHFFNDQTNLTAVGQLHMRNDLRLALEREEFLLYYQPQIELSTGCVVGVEALIRWFHPELGLVPPGRFIHVAEESGQIVAIGEWVLNEACRQAMAWQEAGLPPMSIAVNLSAVQFGRANVELVVRRALEASGLDPGLLELELTETLLIREVDAVLATVKRLKGLGVRLALDDFGTGYSSLSYLKKFEFDKLKIDQSFIRDLPADTENVAIVRAILQMAHSLGIKAIAEGVEKEAALEQLIMLGCDEAQGYLFARPMPPAQVADYLTAAARRTPPGAWSSSFAVLGE